MILTDEQSKEFEVMAKKLMKWLDTNCHPHVSVVADSTHVELLEGQYCAVAGPTGDCRLEG